MKKNLFLGLILFTQICNAQIKAKVDERFELTSIIFALAGAPEYCQSRIPSYFDDINKELHQYAFTEPVDFIRELYQAHRIGYNAVSTTASILEIKRGKVVLKPQYDISKISEIDSRWTEQLFTKYLKMLNVFYNESNFHKFFKKHKDLYDLAEQRMNEYLESTATEWFKSFYGKPLSADINIYISLTNGPHNYAFPEGVLIGMMGDSEGKPTPDTETMSILVHEISHHYSNPLFFDYWNIMEESGNSIYSTVKNQMLAIGYGDAQTVIGEWMNNLFVLMYLKETENSHFRIRLSQNINKGFIWMQRSVDFMDNFYANRDIYPYIEDFLPQLVSFLQFTSKNFDFVEMEYEMSQPYITNIYPAPGSDITNTEEIVITFSEPMLGSKGFDIIRENNIEILLFDKTTWINNNCQIIFKLLPQKREQGHTYGFRLKPEWFISRKYFKLNDKSKDIIFKL